MDGVGSSFVEVEWTRDRCDEAREKKKSWKQRNPMLFLRVSEKKK
jgi:hypothetical protein